MSSEPSFTGGGRTRALSIRRMAQARTMRLSVDPRDGSVRLTLPKRAGLRQALAWVETKRGWIEDALAALPEGRPVRADGAIPYEGEPLPIDWDRRHGRSVRIEDGRLLVGGPEEMVGGRVLRWLRREAAAKLEAETRALADRAGVAIRRVSVADPRARWGSCSTSGDIRYSWRLILAPVRVREATVAHEVAHRLHMDHSPAFHAAVRELLGRHPRWEREWLREHGPQLYWFGAES